MTEQRHKAQQALFQQQMAAEQQRLDAERQRQNQLLLQQYVADIEAKVVRSWLRMADSPAGSSCQVLVKQIPGGEVIDVSILSCSAGVSTGFRNSVEKAVFRASPLPSPPDPQLFDREIAITFKP